MGEVSQEKTGPNATVDTEGLRRFLRERKLGAADDLRVENISFGHSNEVHLAHFEGKHWALRRPPRGPLLPTAHDVMREYRVLSALQDTPVPIPRVYAACDDPSYIGAPFYLMEYMQGDVIRAETRGTFATTPESRRKASEAMIDLLVTLQEVDWRAVGLEGFGRPDGYLPRQLKRWVSQLQGATAITAATRPLPVMGQVAQWLGQRIPQSLPATIVHGDFKLDNVMFDSGGDAKVIAVLDWEMSTIGDPLADLGWLLSYWKEPGETGQRGVTNAVTTEPGFMTRREMLDRYESRTGRRMSDFAFYEAFAIFKLAIIMEGSYSRFIRGQTDDPMFAAMTERVPELADAAWAVCQAAR
jgi:aminoglycoside phosphotransferase (APT) family kinase protein